MKEYPAHIREGENGREEQTVRAHSEAAAGYAAECLEAVRLKAAAYLLGLVHDMGKLKEEYENYLNRAFNGLPVRRGSVNHTFAAVHFLLENFHDALPEKFEDVACEILAYAAGAHHGLFDCVDEHGKDGFFDRLTKENIAYEEAVSAFFAQVIERESYEKLVKDALAELVEKLEEIQTLYENSINEKEIPLQVGFLARLLLSAVIEGDRRDTDEFLNRTVYPRASGDYQLWQTCLARMEKKLDEIPRQSSLNRIRAEISQACKNAAGKPSGIYRLNLPTGAGKTLTALRYALAHAARTDKQRIIFVIPLLTLAEQNSKIIREYIGNDALVLEHHSNAVEIPRDMTDERNDRELYCENWRVPCIVTTLAQMLDTMFSDKTTCVRRFQALCGSVLVFDEIQTVPTKMLSQFNAMLTFLTEICGATIILCSATQPAFANTKRPLLAEPEALVRLSEEQRSVFRRTRLVDLGTRKLEEMPPLISELWEQTQSLLVVCNLKSQAIALYKAFSQQENVFHLSAGMCAEHVLTVLRAINAKLGKEKVLCISTKIAEAGIDFSFATVLRFTAGMDSVVQAAGRCNREGENPSLASVYLVTCTDENLRYLPDIKVGREVTLSLLDSYRQNPKAFSSDLASEQAIHRYYLDFFRATEPVQDYEVKNPVRDSLYTLLSDNVQLSAKCPEKPMQFFMRQAFGLAGSLFEVYEQNTTSVIVPYGEGKTIIAALCSERAKHDFAFVKQLLIKARRYTVSLYEFQYKQLKNAIAPAGDSGALVLAPAYYNKDTGLTIQAEKMDYMGV